MNFGAPVVVDVTWKSLTDPRGGGRKPASAKVFVAFRFGQADSIRLRDAIAEAAAATADVEISDGQNVPEGEPWAKNIRNRIDKSRLVVADLTGPGREVVFEVGLASGKRMIPVCHRSSDVAGMPPWMTADQVRTYDQANLVKVAELVVERARSRQRAPRRGTPSPNKVIWIQGDESSWADNGRRIVTNLASDQGLSVERVDPGSLYSHEDLADCLRSWLVFGCIDGAQADYAAHYLFGDVVARSRAGAGNGKGEFLLREAIAFSPNRDRQVAFLADGAHRVSNTLLARTWTEDTMLTAARAAFARHTKWRSADRD